MDMSPGKLNIVYGGCAIMVAGAITWHLANTWFGLFIIILGLFAALSAYGKETK
jgi:hypothetical protein